MKTFFVIIGLLSFIALIAGMIKPKYVRCPSRSKVALIYGVVLFFSAIMIPDEKQEQKKALELKAREEREFKKAQVREEKERKEREEKELDKANKRIELISVGKAIDLGLPSGTLWAEWNLGATKSEGYGEYFAWGETSGTKDGKNRYAWNTYKLCNGASDLLIKYCSSDGKYILESVDDAATENWGSEWQIPSRNQFEELRANCTWEYLTRDNVCGYLVTSRKNSKQIFLPLSGFCDEQESLWFRNNTGYYWSRELDKDFWTGTNKPYCLILENDETIMSSSRVERCEGISIRPVKVQKIVRKEQTESTEFSQEKVKREKTDQEKLEESLNALEEG